MDGFPTHGTAARWVVQPYEYACLGAAERGATLCIVELAKSYRGTRRAYGGRRRRSWFVRWTNSLRICGHTYCGWRSREDLIKDVDHPLSARGLRKFIVEIAQHVWMHVERGLVVLGGVAIAGTLHLLTGLVCICLIRKMPRRDPAVRSERRDISTQSVEHLDVLCITYLLLLPFPHTHLGGVGGR